MEINEFVMANEKAIRLGVFFGILGVMALWGIGAAIIAARYFRWEARAI